MTVILLTIFCLLMITQVYFYLMLSKPLLFTKKVVRTERNSVSVIVAARNERENLLRLLPALAEQNHSDYEVIIVNDRSEDGTSELIHDFKLRHNHFHVIDIQTLPDGWNGKKHAIYKGVAMAKNEVLLFTDADCLPKSNTWISEMSHEFSKETDIVLGFSPYEVQPGFLNDFIQFETLFVGMQYLGFAQRGKPYMGVGRNMAVRRSQYDLSLLDQMSGLTGGDDDLIVNQLANSTNTKVITNPSSQTVSIPETTWRHYFKQKIRHLSVGEHYQKKDRTLLGVFTLSFLLGWIFFFSLLVSAINPYFILTVYALRSLSFYIIFARIGQKLESPVKLWTLPVLDLCYSIYYPLVGIRALLTKNIQWK